MLDDTAALADQFDTNALAKAGTLQGGATGGVPVIFDKEYLATLEVSGFKPNCIARASDISTADEGKTLTVDGTVYTIRKVKAIDDGAIVAIEMTTG